MTPPPDVDTELAADSARTHYGWEASCTALSGERDRNFLLTRSGHGPVALKFINKSESTEETDLQLRCLEHLAARGLPIATPVPVRTLQGLDCFELITARGPISARAYSYLEGQPAVQSPGSVELRHSVGKAVGSLHTALRDFEHALVSRVLLWDLMHVGQLTAFAEHVDDDAMRCFILAFLDRFERVIAPALARLPFQFIHADISKSNLLLMPNDGHRVAGVLDFGDMVYAPRVADLAIAASYQMSDSEDPMEALEQVKAGYLSAGDLQAEEQAHLLDLVVARLVQRLVLTGWRASRFPENRTYILRSSPDALRLMRALIPVWEVDFSHRHRHSTSMSMSSARP